MAHAYAPRPVGPPLTKDMKGAAILDSRERRAARVAKEQQAMRDAKFRDHFRCRWICKYRSKDLPTDACHRRHRGMGGNPTGDRSKREIIISLCRIDHSRWDHGEIDFLPLTDEGFDGVCDLVELDRETGKWVVVASEKWIGMSVERTSR